MKTLKRIITFATSLAILMLSTVSPIYAATYKVNVDVSTMLGTGGYMYVGTTTDTLTFVVVDRPFALDLDNIDLTRMRTTDGQFELIYEPGKELHYDATAAQRFSEKYGVSIEEIEKYNGIR